MTKRRRKPKLEVTKASPVIITRADGTKSTMRAHGLREGTRLVKRQERAAAKRGTAFWDTR